MLRLAYRTHEVSATASLYQHSISPAASSAAAVDTFVTQRAVLCCAAVVLCRFKVYKGAVKGKPNNSGSAMKQRFSARQW
jgi:hypothetical protein